jgi:hypothetical protein
VPSLDISSPGVELAESHLGIQRRLEEPGHLLDDLVNQRERRGGVLLKVAGPKGFTGDSIDEPDVDPNLSIDPVDTSLDKGTDPQSPPNRV